jgi:hypothetical protein
MRSSEKRADGGRGSAHAVPPTVASEVHSHAPTVAGTAKSYSMRSACTRWTLGLSTAACVRVVSRPGHSAKLAGGTPWDALSSQPRRAALVTSGRTNAASMLIFQNCANAGRAYEQSRVRLWVNVVKWLS